MALNIADLFEHAADAFPDRIALICGDAQVTYRELDEGANRLAHYLAGSGVGPGGHVGHGPSVARSTLTALKQRARPGLASAAAGPVACGS